MAKGVPKEWTLAELNLIWNYPNVGGEKTVTEHCADMGIRYQTWYGMKPRLRAAGGPEALFDKLQDSKGRRNNRSPAVSSEEYRVRRRAARPMSLEMALVKNYQIRSMGAGRDSEQIQYAVTLPPVLAKPFIEALGSQIRYKVVEEGILIVPAPANEVELPSWIPASDGSEDSVEEE